MSATYRLKYLGPDNKWWGVKILTAEGWQDTLDLVPLHLATPFVSEAQAWSVASKFRLLPDRTEIF